MLHLLIGVITLSILSVQWDENKTLLVGGIPILRISVGNENWFEKSESSRNRGKIKGERETTFGLSYRKVRKTEVSRNRDSTVILE